MYWSEKVDRLKQRYNPTDFDDLFLRGPGVLKKIRQAFHPKHSHALFLTLPARSACLRDLSSASVMPRAAISTIVDQLFDERRHLFVVVFAPHRGPAAHVYKCTRPPALDLIALGLGEGPRGIYLVEPKFAWAVLLLQTSAHHVDVFTTRATELTSILLEP